MSHQDQAVSAENGPIETQVLEALREWTGPDEGGWHVNEDPLVSDLSHAQVMAALGRLRRKGLVECAPWHPGQGAPSEWLWFPISPPVGGA